MCCFVTPSAFLKSMRETGLHMSFLSGWSIWHLPRKCEWLLFIALPILVNTRYPQVYFLTSFLPTWSRSYYVIIICGDFNNDSMDDPDSVKFRDLLESVGLRQHVKKSAHNNGHILDRIITRFTDSTICKEPQVDRFRSDHASVICHVVASRPSNYRMLMQTTHNFTYLLSASEAVLARQSAFLLWRSALGPYERGWSRKTLADRASAVAAPRLFNSLPREIRHETCFSTFKTKVKTFLFRTAFC